MILLRFLKCDGLLATYLLLLVTAETAAVASPQALGSTTKTSSHTTSKAGTGAITAALTTSAAASPQTSAESAATPS